MSVSEPWLIVCILAALLYKLDPEGVFGQYLKLVTFQVEYAYYAY